MSVNPIGEWPVDQNTVSLFREPDHFAFSTEGSRGRRYTFGPTLYSMDYAIKLLSMFRRTIGENLARERPQDFPVTLGGVQRVNSLLYESCFLPKLCLDAVGRPGIKVALFYHRGKAQGADGECKGMRWGVFNTSDGTEQTLDASYSEIEAFVRSAPPSNKPSWEPVLKQVKDEQGWEGELDVEQSSSTPLESA
jgi:hypothetical protein